jgi:1-acyl-sn-glycerol-3-phosphate acyltransferase
MSDLFYDAVVLLGRPAFWVSSRPVILGAEHASLPGSLLVAANHTSPYDIPLLMRHVRRRVDFVSITEVFRNPVVAGLYGAMNAFPLERSRPDAPAVRAILERLGRGRCVALFPEGRFRRGSESMVHTGQIRSGLGRIAKLAGAPILPCAIVGSEGYSRFAAWLPLRRTRYGIAFGPALAPGEPEETERQLVEAVARLHAELVTAIGGTRGC